MYLTSNSFCITSSMNNKITNIIYSSNSYFGKVRFNSHFRIGMIDIMTKMTIKANFPEIGIGIIYNN